MLLKSIDEHNRGVLERYHKGYNYTGVACPNCFHELQRVGRGLMISSPPQARVKCYECGYETNIYMEN